MNDISQIVILLASLLTFAVFALLVAIFGKVNKRSRHEMSTNTELANCVNHENSGVKIEEYAPLFRIKGDDGKEIYNHTYKGW